MTENPSEVRDFLRRWKRQTKEDKRVRTEGGGDSGEMWSFGRGDYSMPIWFRHGEMGTATLTGIDPEVRGKKEVDELQGMEKSLEKMILELLEKSNKRPIIALDYGSGVGLSWCRLAKRFENEVKAGNLLLIATNIEKNYFVEAAMEQPHLGFSGEEKEIVDYVLKNKLVKYVEAELAGADGPGVQSLRQLKVQVDDRTVPLIGNVDIANVRMSLTHSLVAEIHFPRLFELLSGSGVYIDSSYSFKKPAYPVDKVDDQWVEDHYSQRVSIYKAYRNVIEEFEMEAVKEVEEGKKKGKELWATVLRKKGTQFPKIYA